MKYYWLNSIKTYLIGILYLIFIILTISIYIKISTSWLEAVNLIYQIVKVFLIIIVYSLRVWILLGKVFFIYLPVCIISNILNFKLKFIRSNLKNLFSFSGAPAVSLLLEKRAKKLVDAIFTPQGTALNNSNNSDYLNSQIKDYEVSRLKDSLNSQVNNILSNKTPNNSVQSELSAIDLKRRGTSIINALNNSNPVSTSEIKKSEGELKSLFEGYQNLLESCNQFGGPE